MKKIVLFNTVIPDIVDKYIHDNHADRFSKGLIDLIESAPVVTSQEFLNRKAELLESGELFTYVEGSLRRVMGSCKRFENFYSIAVVEYDETHRHALSEYDGCETLTDIDDLTCINTEYNLFKL